MLTASLDLNRQFAVSIPFSQITRIFPDERRSSRAILMYALTFFRQRSPCRISAIVLLFASVFSLSGRISAETLESRSESDIELRFENAEECLISRPTHCRGNRRSPGCGEISPCRGPTIGPTALRVLFRDIRSSHGQWTPPTAALLALCCTRVVREPRARWASDQRKRFHSSER